MSDSARAPRWRTALVLALVASALLVQPLRLRAAAPDPFLGICSITSASSLSFGTYDPTSAAPSTSVGSVAVWCLIPPALLEIGISGLNTSGQRQLTGPSTDVLQYNIYQDATYGQLLGDIGSGETIQIPFPIIFVTYTRNYYARIPAGQDVASGSYTGSLVLSVSF